MNKTVFAFALALCGAASQAVAADSTTTINWGTGTAAGSAVVDSENKSAESDVWTESTISLTDIAYGSDEAWSLTGSVTVADTMLFGNKWGSALIATGTNAYNNTNNFKNGAFQIYVQGPAQTLYEVVVACTGANQAVDTGLKLADGDTLNWNLYYAGNQSTEAVLSIWITDDDKSERWQTTLTNVSGSITNLTTGNDSNRLPVSFERHGVTVNTGANAVKIVPEPATATLSLLALAGLAARRRRK